MRVPVPKVLQVIFCDLSLLLSPHEAIRCNLDDIERYDIFFTARVSEPYLPTFKG